MEKIIICLCMLIVSFAIMSPLDAKTIRASSGQEKPLWYHVAVRSSQTEELGNKDYYFNCIDSTVYIVEGLSSNPQIQFINRRKSTIARYSQSLNVVQYGTSTPEDDSLSKRSFRNNLMTLKKYLDDLSAEAFGLRVDTAAQTDSTLSLYVFGDTKTDCGSKSFCDTLTVARSTNLILRLLTNEVSLSVDISNKLIDFFQLGVPAITIIRDCRVPLDIRRISARIEKRCTSIDSLMAIVIEQKTGISKNANVRSVSILGQHGKKNAYFSFMDDDGFLVSRVPNDSILSKKGEIDALIRRCETRDPSFFMAIKNDSIWNGVFDIESKKFGEHAMKISEVAMMPDWFTATYIWNDLSEFQTFQWARTVSFGAGGMKLPKGQVGIQINNFFDAVNVGSSQKSLSRSIWLDTLHNDVFCGDSIFSRTIIGKDTSSTIIRTTVTRFARGPGNITYPSQWRTEYTMKIGSELKMHFLRNFEMKITNATLPEYWFGSYKLRRPISIVPSIMEPNHDSTDLKEHAFAKTVPQVLNNFIDNAARQYRLTKEQVDKLYQILPYDNCYTLVNALKLSDDFDCLQMKMPGKYADGRLSERTRRDAGDVHVEMDKAIRAYDTLQLLFDIVLDGDQKQKHVLAWKRELDGFRDISDVYSKIEKGDTIAYNSVLNPTGKEVSPEQALADAEVVALANLKEGISLSLSGWYDYVMAFSSMHHFSRPQEERLLIVLENYQGRAENYLQTNAEKLKTIQNSVQPSGRNMQINSQTINTQRAQYAEFVNPVLIIFNKMKQMLESGTSD